MPARLFECKSENAGIITPDNSIVAPLAPLRRNAYGLSKIDPPWRFETYSEKGKGKSAEQRYPCMPIEQICALPVADLAHPDGAAKRFVLHVLETIRKQHRWLLA
jgi:hypothetical protein